METYNGMLHYNGWIEFHLYFNDDDNKLSIDEEKIEREKFFEDIKGIMQEFNKYNSRLIEFRQINWMDAFYIGGSHNHAGSNLDDVVDLYRTIGKMATGSHGLLYVHMSEDDFYWNKYRVFRLAKGVLAEYEDTLLSPCNPTIEE